MGEWKEYKLGEVGIIITGKTPSAKNPEDWGKEILFVTPSDYRNYNKYANNSERKLSSCGIDRFKNKVLPPKSLLVTCIGSDMGKVAMSNKKCITNQQINSIIPYKQFNNDFLYYKLIDLYDILRIHGGDGTAVPIVNKSDFENIITKFPPLAEQERIAGILSSLDDKIDLLNRQNRTLESMAETLFRHYFIDNAKEEWKEGKLMDLITIKYGKDHKKVSTGNIPIYGSGGIMRYGNQPLYDKESVLIPRKGSLDNVIYIDNPFWSVDTMFYTEMKRANIAKYIYHFVKNQNLASMNVGSAVPSMTSDILNNMSINIPSDDMLSKFECEVSNWYNKKSSNNNQIRILTKLRDILLPKLMSNEITIE